LIRSWRNSLQSLRATVEGENRGVVAQQEVIVGTIPCPMDMHGKEVVRHDDGEGEGVIGDENEEEVVGENEEE
jgi:hypothetical protein